MLNTFGICHPPLLVYPIWILSLVLWLILMVKALQGERYLLPIVGKMAEQKTGR